MKNFIKYYALEIYTVLTLILITSAAFIEPLSAQRKFLVVFMLLFVLHEWEEMAYPGGFANMVASMLRIQVDEKLAKASRVPTGILLLGITVIPFAFDSCHWLALVPAFLGIFEGFIHVAGIKIFHTGKPYTPGLVTAECELITGVLLFWYYSSRHLVSGWEYLIAAVVMIVCFWIMQKTLTVMVGIRYRDVPKMIKQNIFKG